MEENRKKIFLAALLIVCLGAAAYANAPRGAFLWDDASLVEKNAFIRSASHIPQIFATNVGAGAGNDYRFYRPLQVLTYLLEYPLSKTNPAGYHIGNILWHILSALALFWLLNILFGDYLLALIASALFVVHPVHTEAVTYISGLADPLAAVFVLLTLVFYVKAARTRRPLAAVGAVLSFLAALLSKESALTALPLALLCTYTLRAKAPRTCLGALAAVAAVYTLARFTVLRAMLTHAVVPSTLLQRLPGFFEAWGAYARLLIAPFHLHMEYGLGEPSLLHPRVVAGALVLAALTTVIFLRRRRRGPVFFSLSWFVVALLPVANLYPVNAFMAEHWLYLPSIGFFLLLAYAFTAGFRRPGTKVPALAGLCVLAVFWGVLTYRQNETWREPLAFYQRLLRYAPFSSRLHNALGMAYTKENATREGLPYLEKAAALSAGASPRDAADAYTNLAYAYDRAGRDRDAARAAEAALALDPAHIRAYNNLAVSYVRLKRYEEAVAVCRRALAVEPRQTDVLNTLGAAYLGMGKYEEAAQAYRRVMDLDGDYPYIKENLDLALRGRGEAGAAP